MKAEWIPQGSQVLCPVTGIWKTVKEVICMGEKTVLVWEGENLDFPRLRVDRECEMNVRPKND